MSEAAVALRMIHKRCSPGCRNAPSTKPSDGDRERSAQGEFAGKSASKALHSQSVFVGGAERARLVQVHLHHRCG